MHTFTQPYTYINLTQHRASKEQIEQGVVDLCEEDREKLIELLTFDSLPRWWESELDTRAIKIVDILFSKKENCLGKAMLGGAPYLMSLLEDRLKKVGIEPFYAFTKRVVEEKDGVKTSTFKHLGFVGTR